MPVVHTRTGERMRLSSSHKIFGRERETVEEAYAGDVVGIVGKDDCASATRSPTIRA
jgi:peptide chain release factor 3